MQEESDINRNLSTFTSGVIQNVTPTITSGVIQNIIPSASDIGQNVTPLTADMTDNIAPLSSTIQHISSMSGTVQNTTPSFSVRQDATLSASGIIQNIVLPPYAATHQTTPSASGTIPNMAPSTSGVIQNITRSTSGMIQNMTSSTFRMNQNMTSTSGMIQNMACSTSGDVQTRTLISGTTQNSLFFKSSVIQKSTTLSASGVIRNVVPSRSGLVQSMTVQSRVVQSTTRSTIGVTHKVLPMKSGIGHTITQSRSTINRITTSSCSSRTVIAQMVKSTGKIELAKLSGQSTSKNIFSSVVQGVRNCQMESTGEIINRETRVSESILNSSSDVRAMNMPSLSNNNSGIPTVYKMAYADLLRFVANSLDIYKHELRTILYPVYIHIYLKLVYDDHREEAIDFLSTFRNSQEQYYQNYITLFSCITSREQIMTNDMANTFRSTPFNIRMSRDIVSLLNRYLKEKCNILLQVIEHGVHFDIYEGVARSKNQIESISGAFTGEAKRADNKWKVYYGLLKEPDLHSFLPPEDDEDETSIEFDRPKRKKPKKDPLFNRKAKTDPNSPQNDRMPLPELRDIDKLEKVRAIRESSKRASLGPDLLPSVCCYTVNNAKDAALCAEMSEDGSLLAVGFRDCKIKLWSLTMNKLKTMKNPEQLQSLDIEAEDAMVKMMDERSGETCKTLCGHTGPVYGISFSPDRALFVSCSEDGTARLWCLLTWTCLVVFKGHVYPVWDVEFSPFGYYFVTGSHDKSARLWTTDNQQPTRLFYGHYGDVEIVKFHPNSNYVATGSCDRTVRLWDCTTGSQVRLMTGHKGSITAICFSIDGRYVVSAATDNNIHVWDLSQGYLLAVFNAHDNNISTLAFSRDGSILVSGSKDYILKLWDFSKFAETLTYEETGVSHNPEIKKTGQNYALRAFRTNHSPILGLSFTRKNVLYAICGSETSA